LLNKALLAIAIAGSLANLFFTALTVCEIRVVAII